MEERTLRTKVRNRIKRSKRNVFLRKDFSSLGGYDQVGRALKGLVDSGELVRISFGVFAKTKNSVIKQGNKILAANGGFKEVSREALNRLRIPWQPDPSEAAYNANLTTQVPANASILILKKCTRTIKYKSMSASLVYQENAK